MPIGIPGETGLEEHRAGTESLGLDRVTPEEAP